MITQKLSLKEKIGYGLGDAAASMFWKLFSMYLMFFYTDVFGISAAVVGTMFLITRIWDAAFDPFVGIISDRTETKWGKFRPYLIWMMIPFGIMGVLLFTTPNFSESGKIVYAYVTYSLMMMVYSLINVPDASLMGVMSADGKERTQLSTFRMVFAFIGSLVVLGAVEPLVSVFSKLGGGNDQQQGWQFSAVVFAFVAVVLFFLCFSWTKERVKPIVQKTSLKQDIKDIGANHPWLIMLGASISVIFFNSIRDGAAIYYFKYYVVVQDAFQVNALNITITLSSLYFVLGQAANIVGVILAIPVSNRIGKKGTFLTAMIIASVLSILFYFIDRGNVTQIYVMQVLISLCAGIATPLVWSMFADTADYSEWRTKRRATGLVFSASSMSQKFGWTIGGALCGLLLGYYGFKANVVQTETAQNGIRMMLSFFPAIGSVLAAFFMSIYPLSERKLKKISAELAEQREENAKDN
jgi:GPH family glycoside/pentoside/hexuronide:cation symporter